MNQSSDVFASDSWSIENGNVLERLAQNEDVSVPWPELRRIIRQRLSQVVEQLSQSKQEYRSTQLETNNIETVGQAETSEKRKRSDIDEADEEDVESKAAQSPVADARQGAVPNEGMQDEIMEDNTGDDGRRSGSEESQTPAVAATTTDSSASLAQETNGHGADPTHDIRDLEDRISYSLHTFDEAPFTIQRIAELLAWPERHYRNVLKFLRAVERVVYVTSTVDEFPPCMQNDGAEEAQNDCETQSASNGATATPSTMFSLVASQKEEPSSQQTDKGADPAALSARSESAGSDNSGTRQPEDDSQLSSDATDKAKWAATSAPGIPPLDASDTGIVHIASTAEDEDATRTRIQKVVDSTVPVCIDVPGDTDGKITVVPVHPASSSEEQQHN